MVLARGSTELISPGLPAPNLDFAKSNFNKKRHSLLSIDGLLVPTLPTRPRTSWRRGNCKSPALRSMRSAVFFHLERRPLLRLASCG